MAPYVVIAFYTILSESPGHAGIELIKHRIKKTCSGPENYEKTQFVIETQLQMAQLGPREHRFFINPMIGLYIYIYIYIYVYIYIYIYVCMYVVCRCTPHPR